MWSGLRSRHYVVVVLFAASGILYLRRSAALDMRGWKPLTMPVRLSAGIMQSPAFPTRFDTKYRLLIACQRQIEFRRLQCLMGMESCADVRNEIEIFWRVTHSEAVVASGSSHDFVGGFYSDDVAREIGEFAAKKN